jgi:hypothetical protein
MLKKYRGRKPIRSISVDDLIKAADEWDKRYLEVTIRSLELYDRDQLQTLQEKFLSKRCKDEFNQVNPYSKRLWLSELLKEFLAAHRILHGRSWQEAFDRGKVGCVFATFTHRGWSCSDRDIQFDLKAAKQKIRNALVGCNFVACFEAAVYKNEQYDDGKLISFHCHALAWSNSEAYLRRLQRRIKPRFKPILGNKSGVRFDSRKSETSLANSLLYMGKMPVMGKRTYPKRGGRTGQRNSKIMFRSRKNLFHALKKNKTFDFWLAGGEGGRILRRSKNRLVEKYRQDYRSA